LVGQLSTKLNNQINGFPCCPIEAREFKTKSKQKISSSILEEFFNYFFTG